MYALNENLRLIIPKKLRKNLNGKRTIISIPRPSLKKISFHIFHADLRRDFFILNAKIISRRTLRDIYT